ncbi:MAG: hypothetical protein FJ147_25510 [Deltaproteobacteria bacterium]|nr:hypothetical protein [Deltaproteobacteria bacterium]
MKTQSVTVDPSTVPWKSLALDSDGTVNLQMYLKGADDGPEAIRARICDGYEVEPHFHLAAQFQLLLEGTMTFPMFKLEAPAVHYTEHNVPYGPFIVNEGHDMLVLHTKPGGVIMMRDKERRRQANARGREFSCCAHEVEWEPMPGHTGARRKVLIPAQRGPSAELIECPPQMELTVPVSPYGRYEVVYRGSVLADGKELAPKSIRFVDAGQSASPLVSGPTGASIIVLTYDADAAKSYGGSTEEVLARMEQ